MAYAYNPARLTSLGFFPISPARMIARALAGTDIV
jgi:hypothetical protein